MPLKYFLDGDKKLEINQVLEKGLLAHKYPLAYLRACADQREWKGQASVTQCLNGTRMEYLKIICDYAVDPSDRAFMIVGTRGHKKLEKLTPACSFAELNIPETDITGTLDLLEQQPGGEWWLSDYKVVGAYAIMKALGLVKKKRPAFDPAGNPILYQKSGRWGKAGSQKTEDYFEADPAQIDMKNWVLQLNRYRMIAERYFNIIIASIKIFAIPRDGGTWEAFNKGITGQTYYIDVPFMDNIDVENYFTKKADALISHLKLYDQSGDWKESIPGKCSDEECWNGSRCKGKRDSKGVLIKRNCEVAEYCKQIGDNSYLKGE